MLAFINYYPKDEEMFRTTFILANGVMGVSLFAFGNQFVPSDHDSMASFAIHFVPMVLTLNLRWYVIP